MTTWGPNNFDSNNAIRTAQREVDRLIEDVRQAFKEDGCLFIHVDSDDWLVQTIEIVTALCERGGAEPPPPDEVLDWRNDFLNEFDRQHSGGSGFWEARRAVIERTFVRLEEMVGVCKPGPC